MKEIINSNFDPADYSTVVVDFWADWCMPCKMMMPTFEKVSNEFPNITFVKVNIEENVELAKSLNVNSIPTIIIFRNGKVSSVLVGLQQENKLKEAIQNALLK